jgi:hypothetical protein
VRDDDLKSLERLTFRASADTGLWDMFLASMVAMWVIAPYLSGPLGDFWAAAVFLPFWGVVYLVIRVVQVRVVKPRIGVVRFSPARRKRLAGLSAILLVVNVVALVAGIVAATQGAARQGLVVGLGFGFMLLVGFSLAAFFLEVPRLFVYGLMLATAPFVGEELYRANYASHHGIPLTFGVCLVVILATGVVRFVRFLPARPGGDEQPSAEGNHG